MEHLLYIVIKIVSVTENVCIFKDNPYDVLANNTWT